ncbi:MAG: hypothetical protein MK212_19265 [Saprospiraceae bacterium]|nr:hypothetical protein [Saprospiraceae bacterium]
MKDLHYTELVNGITLDMLEDKKVHIISDTALFLVTTKAHSEQYPQLEFSKVPQDAVEQYGLDKLVFH